MGGLAVLAAATLSPAQQEFEIDASWDPPPELYIPSLNKTDRPVDTLTWTEDHQEPQPDDTWVYVCGWMTNTNNAKVMFVARYWIEDPTDPAGTNHDPIVMQFPEDWATTTLDHIPRAMAVDSEGNIFITAEMETANQGIDYLTLKLDKALDLQESWGNSGIMTFNNPDNDPNGNEDDKPTDIQVYGTSTNQRIFVTGTSFHDGQSRNIVTISYFGTTQSGFTEWVSDYDHDHGNDSANELIAMLHVEQDQSTGWSPVVSGTVREDGEFDIFAMRLKVGTGDVAWAGTYDDPEGTDDECTGLTGGPLGQAEVVVLCGQVGTAAAADTVYLAWALEFVDGTPIWDDDSEPFGTGRAWNVEDTAEGFDWPVDISLGAGPSTTTWVWVTGHGTDGSFQRVGTVAFTISDDTGDIMDEHVFIDPDDEDEDDFAVEFQVAPGEQQPIFITGYTESASALPAFLTLHLVGNPLDTEAFHRYYGHELLNNTAGCWRDPATGSLIVTGWSAASGTGQNWVTIRHNP